MSKYAVGDKVVFEWYGNGLVGLVETVVREGCYNISNGAKMYRITETDIISYADEKEDKVSMSKAIRFNVSSYALLDTIEAIYNSLEKGYSAEITVTKEDGNLSIAVVKNYVGNHEPCVGASR